MGRSYLIVLVAVCAMAWSCTKKSGNVTGPSGVKALRSCQILSAPGQYSLAADIRDTVTNLSCIAIITSDVSLDCGGYAITTPRSAILVEAAHDVIINDCDLNSTGIGVITLFASQSITISNSTVIANSPGGGLALWVDGSQNVSVTNCTFSGTGEGYPTVQFGSTTESQITNNRFVGSTLAIFLDSATFVSVIGNVIMNSGVVGDAGIYAAQGGQNTIQQNQIDGGWDGDLATWGRQGTDDGIDLGAETGDIVQNNTITNVFDAGIEGISQLSNTTIAANTITNAGFAGIGSYHGTSWTGNVVVDNHVANSPSLVQIFYDDDGGAFGFSAIAAITFSNNTFKGNTFQSPTMFPPVQGGRHITSIVIDFSAINEGDLPIPLPLSAANNVIADDTLPTSIAGFFVFPTGAFVDGGGNSCDPTDPGNFTTCGTITASVLSLSRPGVVATPPPPPPLHVIPRRPRLPIVFRAPVS